MPHERDSSLFELLVSRIYGLIEQADTEVIWNKHLPDPDDPKSQRQVDVTLKRNNILTIIECRLHQDPQDVTWVESLIGKRVSLRADAVIAVSSSGFTPLARKKAEVHGIILRDLVSLSAAEVSEWGMTTRVFVEYLVYDSANATVHLDGENLNGTELQRVVDWAKSSTTNMLSQITNKFVDQLNRIDSEPVDIQVFLNPPWIDSAAHVVRKVDFAAIVRRIREEHSVPLVSAYDLPNVHPLERETFVERNSQYATEVIRSGGSVAITLDFSRVRPPEKGQFLSYTVTMKDVTSVTHRIVGFDKGLWFNGVEVRYTFVPNFC